MSKLGIHFPNAGFRNLDALWSIPWDHFVMLDINRDWVPEIRLRFPRATILVRAYLENWAETDPIGWARSIASWADELRPFGIELTFANEQNLAVEGHPLGARPGAEYPPASLYQDILHWNLAVIRELRALLPWVTIHFPALSQGHSDDEPDGGYLGFEILREAITLCDVLDVHVYWDENRSEQRQSVYFAERYRLAHALFPEMPLFVSEAGMLSSATGNTDGAARWLDALPEYVTGACWFIWDSDSKNRMWILRDKPALVRTLQTYGVTHASPVPADSVASPVSIAERIIVSTTPFASARFTAADGRKQLIGYSHIIIPDDGVGKTTSEDHARKLLRGDLVQCLFALEQRIRVGLTSNQKAALLSLIFDVGDSESFTRVLDIIDGSDGIDVTKLRGAWKGASRGDSPGGPQRRQVELALFLRDVIGPAALRPIAGARPLTLTPVAVYTASVAGWITAKHGGLYDVIGVWYDGGPSSLAGSGELTPALGESRGGIAVRVEDENGTGIPAELVMRRKGERVEASQVQWTDAVGAAWFPLDDTSEFVPATSRGPDRIQVGDCIVSGLGTPIPQDGPPAQARYFIRVKKTTQLW